MKWENVIKQNIKLLLKKCNAIGGVYKKVVLIKVTDYNLKYDNEPSSWYQLIEQTYESSNGCMMNQQEFYVDIDRETFTSLSEMYAELAEVVENEEVKESE